MRSKDVEMPVKSILDINEVKELESIGNAATASNFTKFLELIETQQDKQAWKLQPLLTHMPIQIFKEVVLHTPLKLLELLEKPLLHEVVQHQLTALFHVFEDERQNTLQEIFNLEETIQKIKPLEVYSGLLTEILEKISNLRKRNAEIHEVICRVLRLAWNISSESLIDKFSGLKEVFFHLHQLCGEWQISNRSGLFLFLQQQLGKIYDNDPDSPAFRTLDDIDPAYEGLSKLNLHYLIDYHRHGLLDASHNEMILQEAEKSDDRDRFVDEMRQTLLKVNLNTIKDLKETYICSVDMLQEYIKYHSETNPGSA